MNETDGRICLATNDFVSVIVIKSYFEKKLTFFVRTIDFFTFSEIRSTIDILTITLIESERVGKTCT